MRLDPADLQELKPLLSAIVRETIEQAWAADAKLGDRLGYTEAEAAALLGVPKHVLRDARLRGEISARRVGAKYVYGRQSLVAFLGDHT